MVASQVYSRPLHQESVPTPTPMPVLYRVHVYTRDELVRSSRSVTVTGLRESVVDRYSSQLTSVEEAEFLDETK